MRTFPIFLTDFRVVLAHFTCVKVELRRQDMSVVEIDLWYRVAEC